MKATNSQIDAEPTYKQLVNKLSELIASAQIALEQSEDSITYLQALALHNELITDGICALADFGFSQLNQVPEKHDPIDLQLNYEWPPYAKAFTLLWRNVLFENQKAYLLYNTQHTTADHLFRLKEKSNSAIAASSTDLKKYLNHDLSDKATSLQQLESWTQQDNPWPVYKKQLLSIVEQCKKLYQQAIQLKEVVIGYNAIKTQFTFSVQAYLDQFQKQKSTLQNLADKYKSIPDFKAAHVVKEMELLLTGLQHLEQVDGFNSLLQEKVKRLPGEADYCISQSNGLLGIRRINLKQTTKNWLESELMTEIYKLNAIGKQLLNKTSLSIVNIQNRIIDYEQSQQKSNKEEVEQTLNNFVKSVDKSIGQVINIQEHLTDQLTTKFDLSKILDANFLSSTSQFSINQYRNQREKGWSYITNWLKSKSAIFSHLQKKVQDEEALSTSEKIVRTVRHRVPDTSQNQYTNIFLTRGWIGDSFVVGRDDELKRVEDLIENWKLGFRADVMITGQRFSGKTLFGQLVNQRFFNKEAIELSPNKTLLLAGRKFTTTHDLSAALDFVIKNTINQHMMVWIDDLEHWSDNEITLSENVQKLLSVIDQYTGRLFFVVAMTNWLKAHLNRTFDIDKVFQSEINLDNMQAEEVDQAIFIRHNATHMEFIHKKSEENSEAYFKKLSNRAFQSSYGSIGEALHQWTFITTRFDERSVTEKPSPAYLLPDFISIDTALLLQSIMMEKRTNEFRLSKIFGSAFQTEYSAQLQRLINLGIISRINDWLEVNPFLANEIGRQLEQKLNFKFRKTANISKQERL